MYPFAAADTGRALCITPMTRLGVRDNGAPSLQGRTRFSALDRSPPVPNIRRSGWLDGCQPAVIPDARMYCDGVSGRSLGALTCPYQFSSIHRPNRTRVPENAPWRQERSPQYCRKDNLVAYRCWKTSAKHVTIPPHCVPMSGTARQPILCSIGKYQHAPRRRHWPNPVGVHLRQTCPMIRANDMSGQGIKDNGIM